MNLGSNWVIIMKKVLTISWNCLYWEKTFANLNTTYCIWLQDVNDSNPWSKWKTHTVNKVKLSMCLLQKGTLFLDQDPSTNMKGWIRIRIKWFGFRIAGGFRQDCDSGRVSLSFASLFRFLKPNIWKNNMYHSAITDVRLITIAILQSDAKRAFCSLLIRAYEAHTLSQK